MKFEGGFAVDMSYQCECEEKLPDDQYLFSAIVELRLQRIALKKQKCE